MGGNTARGGGPHPSGLGCGDRWPPLPPSGVEGFDRHPSSNISSSQQDEPCSQPRAVSSRARQAFDLYQECVAAGLYARLVLEQKQGGERILFTCRPAAAASYAAVAGGQRRPAAGGQHRPVAEAAGGHRRAHNARRAARKKRWRDLKRAATDATAATVAEVGNASAAEPAAPASPAPISAAVCATPGKRDAAARTPTTRTCPVVSPRVTRASKKRKEMSPPNSDCLQQLDGEVASPPESPPSRVGSLSAPTQLLSVVCGVGSPSPPTPPLPPPPWQVEGSNSSPPPSPASPVEDSQRPLEPCARAPFGFSFK